MAPKSLQFMHNCGFLNTNSFLNARKHKIYRGICARQLSVLVLNCGSSSIKFKILDSESGEVTLDGQANNLNTNKVTLLVYINQKFLTNKILMFCVNILICIFLS